MNYRRWLLVILMLALAIDAYVAVQHFRFGALTLDWCGTDRDHCFREWTAALSGWAAAVGALVAVMLTLPALRQQVKEARSQTRFMLGDSPPTLDLVESTDPRGTTTFDFVVTNWNRRHFDISHIRIQMVGYDDRHFFADVTLGSTTEIEGAFVERKSQTSYRDTGYEPPISQPGWKNRSKQPPGIRYEVIVALHDVIALPAVRQFEVTIEGRISRAESKTTPLQATGYFSIRKDR